ncbi:MAG: hypothetical protein Tsb008_23170 [Rhodothalassiaceae bacterium]
MTTDASWPLQTAILNALRNDGELVALLGGVEAIGRERRNGEEPSLFYGDCATRAWHSATFDGQVHDIVIEVTCAAGGSARAIASRIIGLLHDADLPIPGHALIELEFVSSETRSFERAGLEHSRLMFHGLTVSD